MAKFFEVKAKFNDTIMDVPAAEAALEDIMVRKADQIRIVLSSLTHGWRNPPTFTVKRVPNRGIQVTYDSRTKAGKIFDWLDQGVKVHRIPAKGLKPMRFKWAGRGTYQAKTAPGVFTRTGGKGTPDNAPWVSSHLIVKHPGIKARKFTQQATQDIVPDIQREIKAHVLKAFAGQPYKLTRSELAAIGGKALFKQRGSAYMARIGRLGGLATARRNR